jgi:hypothetical protein
MLSNNNQRCGYTLRVTSQASFSKIVFHKYILPYVKIPRYFYIYLVFSNTILLVFSVISPNFCPN